MPISLTCPRCDAPISVPSEYAGQFGPCPACGQQVSVPPARQERPSTRPRGVLAVRLRTWALARTILLGAFLIMLAWFVIRSVPIVQTVKDLSNTSACVGNLRRIGQAVLAYEAAHGTFPPAYLADENGQPIHSWRVLILPYLDQQDLYDNYDFDEAWNGPQNSLLADQIGDIYRCPCELETVDQWLEEEGGFLDTSYMMIVGPNTITDGPSTKKSLADVTDLPFDTFLVVETAGSRVHWMDPRDLTEHGLSQDSYSPSPPMIWGEHSAGAHAVMCDGSVRVIPDAIEPDQLKAMSTISGGEAVWSY